LNNWGKLYADFCIDTFPITLLFAIVALIMLRWEGGLFYITKKETKERRECKQMDSLIGQQWGNYHLIQHLGSGGFAQVYLGQHIRLGMKAAIKILQTHLTGNEVSAFQREAKIIANLKHAHIIRVFDFDLHNGTPYLVLDYASQGSLRQKHPFGTKLPLSLINTYVTQIASALEYAHNCKLIHRDVKPENLLLGDQGQILLTDFGIATIAHATGSLSGQGSVGTLAYMAPEQIQGRPRAASDQYALAIVIYQWVCGTLPFQGATTEIIAQHLAAPPPPPSKYAPDCPLEVEQVILKALAKDPKARFENIRAFASAFEHACEPVSSSKKMFSLAVHASSAIVSTAANLPGASLFVERATPGKPASTPTAEEQATTMPQTILSPRSLFHSGLLYGRWFVVQQAAVTLIAALICTLWPFPPDLLSHLSPLEILLFKTQYMINAMIVGTSKWFFIPDLAHAAVDIPALIILASRVVPLILSFGIGVFVVRRTGKIRNGVAISLWAHLWSLVAYLFILLLLVIVYEWLWNTTEPPNAVDVSPEIWISWFPAWASTTFLFLALDTGLTTLAGFLNKKRK
jgi:serine/threonine protein kinase